MFIVVYMTMHGYGTSCRAYAPVLCSIYIAVRSIVLIIHIYDIYICMCVRVRARVRVRVRACARVRVCVLEGHKED